MSYQIGSNNNSGTFITAHAINSGGSAYVSVGGINYSADTGFTGGLTASTANPISGTLDDILYQTERYANTGSFSYALAVTVGKTYRITFQLAERFAGITGPGQRVFDIQIEGVTVFENVDIYKEVGFEAAYDLVYDYTASDSTLNLNFVSNIQNAKSGAILIQEIPINSVESLGTAITPGTLELSDGTFSVQLTAPAGLTSYIPFRFPSSVGQGGQILVNNGGGTAEWKDTSSPMEWIIVDEKGSGVDGGTFTAGVWQTRDLNTLYKPDNVNTDITVVANQIIIEDGTYLVYGSAPTINTGDHKTRFFNITDAVTELFGSSERIRQNQGTRSILNGLLVVSGGPKTYEFQHACQFTEVLDGFGSASGFGINEVYTIIYFIKLV